MSYMLMPHRLCNSSTTAASSMVLTPLCILRRRNDTNTPVTSGAMHLTGMINLESFLAHRYLLKPSISTYLVLQSLSTTSSGSCVSRSMIDRRSRFSAAVSFAPGIFKTCIDCVQFYGFQVFKGFLFFIYKVDSFCLW